MARVSKEVKLYQDIQQNPELRQINSLVNQINNEIASMGRSSYFKDIVVPEPLDKYDIIQSAKDDIVQAKQTLETYKSALQGIWNIRRSEGKLESETGIVKTEQGFVKTLSINPQSAVQRAEKSKSKRGVLTEKAVRILLANDITLLKRLTNASDSEIIEFLNKWYESVNVSGGQKLSDFLDAVYQREFSGQGASQSWTSAQVKLIVQNEISDSLDNEPDYSEEELKSYETEQKMSDSLWNAWMRLLNS